MNSYVSNQSALNQWLAEMQGSEYFGDIIVSYQKATQVAFGWAHTEYPTLQRVTQYSVDGRGTLDHLTMIRNGSRVTPREVENDSKNVWVLWDEHRGDTTFLTVYQIEG